MGCSYKNNSLISNNRDKIFPISKGVFCKMKKKKDWLDIGYVVKQLQFSYEQRYKECFLISNCLIGKITN